MDALKKVPHNPYFWNPHTALPTGIIAPSGNVLTSVKSLPEEIFDPNGNISVSIGDQTTDPIIAYFNKVTDSTTLASPVSLNSREITVTSVSGIAEGSYLILFNAENRRFSTFFVTSIAR